MSNFRIVIIDRSEKIRYLDVTADNRDKAEDIAFERRSEWESLPITQTVSEIYIEEVKEKKE